MRFGRVNIKQILADPHLRLRLLDNLERHIKSIPMDGTHPQRRNDMRFEYNGEQYRLQFEHHQGGTRRETICRILRLSPDGGWAVRAIGFGFQSPDDKHYNRELGRRSALSRTLLGSAYLHDHHGRLQFLPGGVKRKRVGVPMENRAYPKHPRDFRKAAWAAYWDRKNMTVARLTNA